MQWSSIFIGHMLIYSQTQSFFKVILSESKKGARFYGLNPGPLSPNQLGEEPLPNAGSSMDKGDLV